MISKSNQPSIQANHIAWRASIQWRLIIFSLLIALIPVAIVGTVAFLQARDTIQEQISTAVQGQAGAVGSDLQRYMFERRGDVSVMSQNDVLTDASISVADKVTYLKTVQTVYEAYASITLTDQNGRIIAATDETSGDFSDEAWFKDAIEQNTIVVSDVYESATDKKLVISISSPVYNSAGKLLGVIVANVDHINLNNIVAETVIGKSGDVFFVNREGRIVLDKDVSHLFVDVNHLQAIQSGLRGETGSTVELDHTGVLALLDYVPISGLEDWSAIAALPYVEIQDPINALAARTVLLAAIAAVIVTIAVVFIARRIVQPIQTLTTSAQRLSAGDFAATIPVTGNDEIGQLADTFRSMAGELQALVESLEERVQARTADLSKTMEVGRLANSINQEEELLPRLVDYIGNSFDLYYTQIYLLDEAQRFAILRAGTGEVGQQLLIRQHRLDTAETSLVARAVQSGLPVVVSDTGADATHKPNPLLPDTRSEVAIPIKFGNTILGVLDMQANHPGTFSNENAEVFEAMAGQIAAAIRGAQAFDEAQAAVARAEAVNERLTNETWQSYLGSLNDGTRLGYEYDLETPRPLSIEFDALQAGDGENRSAHPITVRGATIGSIVVRNDEGYELEEEEQTLIQETASIMARALEQFRAFDELKRSQEEITRRAAQMETVAQVSAASASILDVDDLLQTVSDLAKENFDLYHAHVYLLDETGETLLLTAGAGEAGRIMRANQHSIPLSREGSLVATAARERRALITNDVTQEPNFLPNPLLPETRSEMALPMVVADRVIGVVDLQANTVNRFTEEDVRVQISLTNQIAVAVENANAFAEQQQTAERLREVDKLKSQFLANMSHELRTPLNSIIGYAEVLLDGIDGELNDEAMQDVESIHSGGKHLLTIINDILDLAKIEAGQMVMDSREINPMMVIEDVINTCDILARNKGLTLHVETQGDIPTVMGDAVRMKQIVLNLVNNAIKFTDQGSVTVDVERYDQRQLIVRIRDTGMGMTSEDLEGLFQQFHQVDGSPTRRAGGTGLGLVITRHLVHLHGGEIDVESEKDAGTTFWFTLPVYARASQTLQAVQA